MIVKIQKALFPPNGPALIYDQSKDFMTEMPFSDLPPDVRSALARANKVYWDLIRNPGRRGPLMYRGQAETQSW